MQISINSIFTIYDGSKEYPSTFLENVRGIGSVFTVVATGTIGQTALVQGSIDQEHWVDIASLTIESDINALSAVVQHTFPYLKITGDAVVKISRGSA